MTYEAVIGLEIHTQLDTKTKAWCDCEIKVNGFENHYVCEICSGHPGTLPVLNKTSVDYAIKLALATNCRINHCSFFDRKNYFYPDLPKGYQITQYHTPIAEDGFVEIENKKIRIQRIQMEEDTGKSQHEGNTSLINLNRAGTPLLEIVTDPDFSDSTEAVAFLKKLHAILVYLGVSKGDMQHGNLRCDVNLSLRKKGEQKFGTRTEVKNLNSFRSVEKAIEYEMSRQSKILDKGEKVLQQTMLFDVQTLKTRAIRTKSDADDYRYFVEPDLLPLVLSEAHIERVKETLPELPDAKKQRFIEIYDIPEYDANILCSSKELADYFESSAQLYDKGNYKQLSNWIMVELLKLVNESQASITKINVTATKLVELLKLIDNGTISGKIAKDVLVEMFDTNKSASEVIEKKGVKQNSDEDQLRTYAEEIIKNHPKEVEELKNGRDRLMGFFVGQVMKKTKGQANPQMTSEIIKKLLGL
ncbi:MAG: Asp-tRNA(Asn)/Glu-tRNA(Gln) amidotransferase subunit GatB [Halobacteriovoraceae bacterium]|nr:Asp-tRNA(Asn)/Glu-tRNA(Gln) amidotransferase subunit GatB [Halobacteriovoraceae bacterium]